MECGMVSVKAPPKAPLTGTWTVKAGHARMLKGGPRHRGARQFPKRGDRIIASVRVDR